MIAGPVRRWTNAGLRETSSRCKQRRHKVRSRHWQYWSMSKYYSSIDTESPVLQDLSVVSQQSP